MATYSTVLTNIGRTQIINSQITGTALRWSKMAVGDGNGRSVVPSSETTALVNETYRAAINTLYRDPDDATQIIAELVILPQTGGWTLREVGIFDEDDNLVVYGSLPAVVKPVLDEGSGATLTIRCRALVGSEAQVKLIIDPSIVIATRQYAEQYADTKDKALLDSLHGVTLYSNQKDYVSGDIVVQSGQVYVCIAANGPSSVVADVTDTAYWQRVITTAATRSAAGYMSAADKTKLDNTATAWTDLGAKLMTATVSRSLIYNLLGVTGNHYADGHLHDLNYQTSTLTIFNGWDDVHRANYPTGAADKFSASLIVPFNYDLQNNTPLYEFSCCQILLSESGDVWARKKENGSWSSWSYKNSIFPIDGTLTKKIDIGVGTSYSKAFRVGSMGFVVIDDSFPSVNTEDTYYQIYDTNLKAAKETSAPVYDYSGRIVGYAWVNINGVVFVRGLYTGTHVGVLYTCIQYPVSV